MWFADLPPQEEEALDGYRKLVNELMRLLLNRQLFTFVTGGIIEQEGFIHASNVMLVDPQDNRPSRVRVEERDGKRVRVFVKSGDPVPEAVRS